MSYPYDRTLSVPSEVLIQELDDEAVILNLNSARYFGLDPVGTRILTLLDESATIQEAYDRLLREYEVEPERCERELLTLLNKLADIRLIEVCNEKSL